MSCHELAGGQNYTGLGNDYQRFIDLSELVKNRRAILIGRRQGAATRLTSGERPLVDQAGQDLTLCRFVFPVKIQSDH